MNSDVKKEFARLKRLISLEDKSDAYIEKIAEKNVFVRELVNTGNFIDDTEKKEAKRLFDAYLDHNAFENYADLQTLGQLVYNEILIQRIQRTINTQRTKEDEFYVNDKLVKSLHDTENQVEELKKRLNLNKTEKSDQLTELEQLEKGLLLEYEFNKNEFTTVSPCCGQLLRFNRRVKDFEAIKHPAFVGRWLCNLRMLEDIEKGELTIEKAAYYQHTTPYYIQWLLDHKGEVIEVAGYTEEEIKEYLSQKPHLKGF